MRQQEAILTKKYTPVVAARGGSPCSSRECGEVRHDNIRKDMAKHRNINKKTLRSDLLKISIDEERGLLTPVPVDNSIPDINQTGVSEIYRVPNTTTNDTCSFYSSVLRETLPMMPEPVDNAIL
jgi:hypothetical protein